MMVYITYWRSWQCPRQHIFRTKQVTFSFFQFGIYKRHVSEQSNTSSKNSGAKHQRHACLLQYKTTTHLQCPTCNKVSNYAHEPIHQLIFLYLSMICLQTTILQTASDTIPFKFKQYSFKVHRSEKSKGVCIVYQVL